MNVDNVPICVTIRSRKLTPHAEASTHLIMHYSFNNTFTCRLYTDVSSRLVVLYLLLWSANVPLAQSAKLGEPSTRNESIQDFIIMVSVYCTCRQTSDKSSIHESMTSGFSHIMAEPCNESIPIKCRDLTWLYSAHKVKTQYV